MRDNPHYVGTDRNGAHIQIGDAVRIFCGSRPELFALGVVSPCRPDLDDSPAPYTIVVPLRMEHGFGHERWRCDAYPIEVTRENDPRA